MPLVLDEALAVARLSMTNVKLKSFLKWVLKRVWALDNGTGPHCSSREIHMAWKHRTPIL